LLVGVRNSADKLAGFLVETRAGGLLDRAVRFYYKMFCDKNPLLFYARSQTLIHCKCGDVNVMANSNKNTPMHAALILIGFTSVIAQIVLMRELIVVFHGNEISLGIILANWLLWTSVGSGLAGRLVSRAGRTRPIVAGLQTALAVILPLTIVAVRVVRLLYHATPGEILGPGPMFLTTFLVTSLFCITSGCLFAAGSRLYERARNSSITTATGFVYLLEAIGSGLGGLLSSLVLIRHFSSCEIALFLAVLNLTAAAALHVQHPSLRTKIIGALLVCAGLAIAFAGGQALDKQTLHYLWRNLDVRDVRNSIYGNLAVIETEGARSVYQNGWVLFTVPDPEAAEENVHYALLQHPAPCSLLLIGGGMNGSLIEALKHPTLRQVDYVELDPAILQLYSDYFASEWEAIESEERVTIHHMDGRFFLQRSQKTYDVIILNLPDPQTAQLNRFYTEEFFRSAGRHLSTGGVFSFHVTGAENYITEELAAFLRCINKTLSRIFPDVEHIPGASIHFFASTAGGALDNDPNVLAERLRSRRLNTQYVSEHYLPFRMMPDRMQDLESSTHAAPDTPVNRDFTPIAYYFNVALWSTRFHSAYRWLFHTIARIGFAWLSATAAAILIAIVAFAMQRRRGANRLQTTAGICVAGMGFTMIGVEVLLFLAFQAIYGYVYSQLAVIVAAFMAGMALGSRGSLRRLAHRSSRGPSHAGEDMSIAHIVKRLIAVQWIAVILPVMLVAVFQVLSGAAGRAGMSAAGNILFAVLALLCGGLGGYQFPICSEMYFAGGREKREGLGAVYAFDLAGACIGAILFSTFLIPLFGFMKTALLMALVNIAPVVLLSASLPAWKRSAKPSQ
jgi:spermidine synthase